ncbi:ATP-binding cassette sub-family A member 9-like [Folsomia candida]|uniref:ATP-binding cassette sub-family A member 9-like n=1 Tax=Folsomia candida TaxID=158441 RepID=UPI001604C540|nr:ATP-binding cassette sub-family A member 9-like [Folsomia candida]
MTLSKVYPEMSRAFNSFSSTQKADSQSGWVRGKPTMTNPHHLSAASITSLKRDGNDSSSTSVGSAGSGSIARPNLKSRMFLRHRNIVFLLIEVLVPVAITCAIIAAFTSGISWKKSYYEKQDASDKTKLANKFHEVSMQEAMVNFSTRYTNNDGRIFILFTPVNSFTESIMARVRVLLLDERSLAKNPLETYPAATIKNGILGVETFEELIENTLIHRDETDAHGKPIGVVFHYNHKAIDPVTEVPYRLSFSIRHFEESISNTLDPYPYVKPRIATSPYIETGFIGLQYAIQYSYFQHLHQKIHSNKTVNLKSPTILTIDDAPVVKLHMFYFPNFYNVDVRTLITFVVCFCLVIAYLFTSFFILRQLVQENQSGIKEILNMHGMPTYLHWLILFVHALLFRGITAILMTLVLHTKFTFGKIISLSDTSLIFVLLWVHLLALTFFNFFLTTVIHSATFVGAYAILIGLVSFIAPTTFYKFGVIERVGNIILAFFFPNWALYNIFFYIINFDCDEKGVLWSNIKTKGQKGDTSYFTLFEGLLIMGASAIFYFLLATYINLTSQAKMFPPTLKWWDVIGRKKQWKENMSRQQELLIEIREGKDDNFEKPAIYEESNSGNKCYVRVRHLCKRFGKHKMALDTINMNIMHEEITVILGHGGSGKSTLVSILAGLLNPTAGYATIKNHDVIFEANKAGHFVGLCSQTLIYFNLLNVKQHLYLCYRIRDYYPDSMTNEELRRLNIAMAMADSPKVLLLDEPTMGMDAFGRREIWNILKILKHHHTVILTSTYMDEAEYLADKIALLAHGRLICYGSVEFLKKQYDTGYFLKCSPFRDVKLDAQAILALVRNRVGENAEEQKNSTIKDVDNLIIELPIVDFLKFSELCEDFDRNQIKMGIKKYTFKQIGLNDIFIKICESISIDKDGPDLYVRRDSAGDVRSAMTCTHCTVSYPL